MAGVRVNPAEVGPLLAAALETAAAALVTPAAIPPPVPAGADPVSVTAANHVALNASQLTSQLVAAIPRLIEGASAVIAALQGYVATDAAGAALVGGTGGAAAGAVASAINIASPPTIAIPDVPIDLLAAVASVIPVEPDLIDDALRSGMGESGLEIHATAWDAAAAEIRTAAQGLQMLAGNLPGVWEGLDATALAGRLQTFAQWMDDSASAAGVQATVARDVGSAWSTAYANHPRAEDYQRVRQQYLDALARASAGDPRAAAEAAQLEAELTRMRAESGQAMTNYGQGAGGANEQASHPGESPSIAQQAGRNGNGGDGAGEQAKGQGDQMGQQASQMMQQMMQMPAQMAGALGQSVGQLGQQVGQMGQQAMQAATQAASQMAGKASSLPTGAGLPRSPLGAAGSGGGAGAGGGGAGAGGRTMPAGLPLQAEASPQTPASTSATPTGGGKTAGMGGMGMGGMGMMPHGAKGGEAKELDRNKEWFPDESLVTDEAETTDPIAGLRKRVRPTET